MTEPNEPNDQPTPADDNDADDTTIEDSALDPRTREAFKKLRSENHSLRTRLRDSEEQVGDRLRAAVGAPPPGDRGRSQSGRTNRPDGLHGAHPTPASSSMSSTKWWATKSPKPRKR